MIPKTLNELQDKLRAAANAKYADIESNKNRFWPQEIVPEQPVMAGSTILNNWDNDSLYESTFTVDPKTGEVTLGDSTKVEAITNYEAVKWAEAEGSYEFIQVKICDAIQQTLNSNQYISIKGTWPDHVAVAIITEDPVTYNVERSIFNYPYTIDSKYEVTLGDPTPAQEIKRFEAVKMGAFASKDDAKRLVFGPVMIPDCPDCDFARGEKVFNAEEIEEFCHKFNTFRINDSMHTYGANGEQTGNVVENYTLKQELTETNILGEEITYPVGTWWIGSKVTNDETWKQIQDGTLKGYSGTYIPETDANKLLEVLASATKSECDVLADLYASKRTLIKDLDNPVPVTVSFVDRPCVANAIFTSVKSDESLVTKAGRMFSSANMTMLQKTRDMIDSLLAKAKDDSQTTKISKNKPLEVLDMEEKDVQNIVDKAVAKANEESTKTINELKEEIETLKKEPEEEPKKSGKEDPKKSEKKEEEEDEKVESVKTEDDPVIKGILDTQNLIVEKLGINPAKKSLESPNTTSQSANKRKSIKEMAERT